MASTAQRKEMEFSRASGVTYLDHAGTTLYPRQQLQAYIDDLTSSLYGNPHSHNPSSTLTSECIEHVREVILRHFGTGLHQYDVIFTSGCTAALKLLAETFPWMGRADHHEEEEVMYVESMDAGSQAVKQGEEESRSVFCYLEDNHTSVLGMREVASEHGAGLVCVSSACMDEATLASRHGGPCSNSTSPVASPTSLSRPLHLFVYPAQSNFNGRKYPLSWISDISNGHLTIPGHAHTKGSWLVALDAAALVGTNPLDLSLCLAHFVTISFYKIFGFPTGLGALLVRRDCCPLLGEKKRGKYFGGGTVLASIASQRYHLPRPEAHDRLEHGTVSFLDILAVRHGFETLKMSPDTICQHTFFLAQFTYTEMSAMKHSNGQPVCILYHHHTDFTNPSEQGGVVTFNLKRPDGSYVGYSVVDKLASANNIHIRTGCFCNPGACQRALGLTNDHLMRNIQAGHHCGDNIDLVRGQPTGCVRVSFGNMSALSDAKAFIDFVSRCFVDLGVGCIKKGVGGRSVDSSEAETAVSPLSGERSYQQVISCGDSVSAVCSSGDVVEQVLVKLMLYPVKSCSGFEVKKWPTGPKGLLYDREWMVVSEQGYCISQKQVPAMALLLPHVDLDTDTLTLTKRDSDLPELVVRAQTKEEEMSDDPFNMCHTRVCGDRIQGWGCGQEVSEWLTKALGKNCKLVRQGKEERRKDAGGLSVPLSLSNKAQYLMVTLSSIRHLHEVLSGLEEEKLNIEELLQRFRPNLVVKRKDELDQAEPFDEDNWTDVTIGSYQLQVIEKCSRCQMVCVDQSTSKRGSQPLKSLLALRGNKAQFGIYLAAKAT